MEELTKQQASIGQEIERLIRNYKKDSDVRKTSEYLSKKLTNLEEQWRRFEDNHAQLQEFEAESPDHDYFKMNYYDAVQKGYADLQADILQRLQQVEPATKPTDDATSGVEELPKQAAPASNVTRHIAETSSNATKKNVDLAKQDRQQFSFTETLNKETDEDKELKQLVRRQKAIMRILTHNLEDIESKAQESFSSAYYNLKIQAINHYWADISKYNQQIWATAEEAEPFGYQLEYYSSMETWVHETLISLQQRMDINSGTTTKGNHHVKLPKVTLPTFSGDYLKWSQFRELYVQMIHSQPMSKSEKMYYLSGNLTGDAKSLIQHLTVSEQNYDTAWQILENRYNNKRLLVTALLNKLLGQSTIVTESAQAIKSLHDVTKECVLGIKNLGIDIDDWDPILLHLILKKLDRATHALYEQNLDSPRELQNFNEFLSFLELRFQALEALGPSIRQGLLQRRTPIKSSVLVTTNKSRRSCRYCSKNHAIYACTAFLKLSPTERQKMVNKLQICPNCLRDGHQLSKCSSRGCSKCKGTHNTLLHVELPKQISQGNNLIEHKGSSTSQSSNEQSIATNLAAHTKERSNLSYVFLGTALIYVLDRDGNSVPCRAILDSGSQMNFMTERLFKLLKLPFTKGELNVNGIGNCNLKANKRANVTIISKHTGYNTSIETFVITEIAANQPQRLIATRSWPIPSNIKLADPEFNEPRKVDLLIGAELYSELLSVGHIKLSKDLPSLQNTVLGWIVLGKASNIPTSEAFCGISHTDLDLNSQLQRFWELEEVKSSTRSMTSTEHQCEAFFKETTIRNASGRFVVRLPLRKEPSELGDSTALAIRRFLSLEKKFIRNPTLKAQYISFMEEYYNLKHMEILRESTIPTPHYFIPHHCVLKPDSTTTKFRVVFDASSKTSNNLSLNEILLKGPVIQDDLFSILLRFRMYKYVITGDIEKMYRQILVNEEDRNLQLIFWRDDPKKELQVFRLNTVTYGTTSAPYLATKCLQTLANQGEAKYPLATRIIRRDFYVDDLMSGSNSINEAIEIQKQTRELLATAGFHLRKWCANHPKLLEGIPKEDIELELNLDDNTEGKIKTLGLTWRPQNDLFSITTSWVETTRITKRTILADTAQLFDPLGFVNPVIVTAKILLQKLWLLKLDWDAALPMELHTQWVHFREGLKILKNLKVPRHVLTSSTSSILQFHGFSDASERAYAAAIYVRSIDRQGNFTVRLLCAKSRVAPTKTQTIPRLELCAARLLAQLMNQVQKAIQPSEDQLYFWTDSSIVLAWIRSESSSFKTFVANRIAAIQELTDPKKWNHVKGDQNPADLGSRGTTAEELCNSELWFTGPEFLRKPESEWSYEAITQPLIDSERKEQRAALVASYSRSSITSNINHKNSFNFLQRTMAYILRFIRNLRTQGNNNKKLSGPLTVPELENALEVTIKEIQARHFSEELKKLKRHGHLEAQNKLATLTPFMDKNGIMRVGGRLQAANLHYDSKHPILLPHSDEFTKLLMEHLHIKYLHAGPQALLAFTRQRFWPLRGKTLAISIVRKCMRCARAKPKDINQLMGNLPPERIQPARPFIHVGIDFCGPIHIHYKLRGKRPTKAYIAVFVCFCTKAVHLEVVSDLTTAAFIAALKRFIGRRGRPTKIFCDNATNFVGAKNELKEVNELIHQNQREITEQCTQEHIQWCFIPPRSPHFGGLWESAVKSTKYHLTRVLMGTSPTYEELSTIIIEIEAILNSRPLTPLTNNPNDMQALTPGHFLIGEPLTSLSNLETTPTKLANRWKLIKNAQREFWRRWSREYLQELQSRNKWRTYGMPVNPGMLVLLKEENLPPLKWQLARVIKEHKGKDGLTRVVDLKTSTGGIVTRAITKICPLPVETSENNKGEENQETSNHTALLVTTHINQLQGIEEQTTKQGHAERGYLERGNATQTSSSAFHQRVSQPVKHRLKGRFAPINSAWLSSPNLMKQSTQLQKYNKRTTPETNYQDKVPSTGKKRLKSGTVQTIIGLLFVINLVLPVLGQATKEVVEIIPFKPNTGLYFEGIGQVHMITDEWHIIAYYDLENYWNELNGLRNCLKQLTTLCSSMPAYEDYCTVIAAQLKHQLADIEHANEILLKSNDPTASIRPKRSPFDIIGTISNKLFGILDQEYAERMSKTIKGVERNEIHLLELIKNQTSIIESTINIMKKSDEHLHSQFAQISSYIDELSTNITQEVNHQRIIQIFNSISIHSMLIITGYERVQTALIEVFTDTRTGRLNPLLVTPQQLRQELSLIRENLPSSLSLPEQVVRNSDMLNWYNLMTVKARITVEHAIFSIRIPLVSLEVYEAFNIVPIPMSIKDEVVLIQDTADILIVNLLHDRYYPINKVDFDKCLKGSTNVYICQQHGTMYHKTIGKHQCELELLNQKRQLPDTCRLTAVINTDNWIHLHNPNQWIYAFTKETIIKIACGKTSSQGLLQGQGLLTFKANCILRQDMITLSSHNQGSSMIRTSFASSILLNTTSGIHQQDPARERKQNKHLMPNTTNEVKHLDEMLRQIREQERILSTGELGSTDIHQFSIAYIALALAFIVAAYFIGTRIMHWLRRESSNTVTDRPEPAPRRNFTFQP